MKKMLRGDSNTARWL